MEKKEFEKYRKRITREAVLKAVLGGLIVGCIATAIMELFCWFFGFKAGLYIAPVLLVCLSVGFAIGFYYKKYRPTTKSIARRVDELGLEERVITMIELEGDDSYIATAQREDTMKALGSVNHMLIKFAITVAMVVMICVGGFLFAGATTVNSLYYAGVIPSGMELVRGEPEIPEYSVEYNVESGTKGSIVFNTDDSRRGLAVDRKLTVNEGEDAPMVAAVPARGWAFVSWSDGVATPYRHDLAVKGNIDVFATFEEFEDNADKDEPPEDDDINNSSSGNSSGNAVDKPDDNENKNRFLPSNQLEDGNTYYGDGYEDTVKDGMDKMKQNDNLSESRKKAAENYYEALDPSENEEGEG